MGLVGLYNARPASKQNTALFQKRKKKQFPQKRKTEH
jgi:hypothetical protein